MTTKKQDPKELATNAPLSPLDRWKAELTLSKTVTNLSRALQGTGITPARFAFTAYMVASRTPKLLDANRSQLWLGVYSAAECGLSLQPHMQQMHLVPFGKEVTPIVGYQGLTYLVSKAGQGLMDVPTIVYQRDVDENRFRYRSGTGRRCELDPVVRDITKPKGAVRYAFTTFTSASGVTTFHCIDREELLEARERSSGWQAFKAGRRKSSPWEIKFTDDGSETGDFIPMCMKTVARRFAKYLPKSTDHWGDRAAKADAIESAVDAGDPLDGVLDTSVLEDAEATANDLLKRQLGEEEGQIE